jgi:hypothetical protein
VAKQLTEEEAQARKDKAVRFVRDALDDPDHADDLEDEGLYDWAERKRIQIVNEGEPKMANGNGSNDPRTKGELLDEIDSLQQQVDDLNDTLDSIMDLAGGGTPEDDDDDYDDDSDGDDQD